VSERPTSPGQNRTREKQMETGDEVIVGHLRAFCPWIMMKMRMMGRTESNTFHTTEALNESTAHWVYICGTGSNMGSLAYQS